MTVHFHRARHFSHMKVIIFYNVDKENLNIPYLKNSITPPLLSKSSNNTEFNLLLMKSGKRLGEGVYIGINEESKVGYDSYDRFAPPGDFVKNRITIYNENLQTNYKYLHKDYRAEIGDIQIYDLVIEVEPNKLLLNTEGTENFEEYNIYLIDTRLNNVYDLRDGKTDLQSIHTTNEYKLIIGKPELTEEFIKELTPNKFVLYQNYPNPFFRQRRIRLRRKPIDHYSVFYT